MYDAIIVGSGPAGYTAGIYLSRAGLKNRLITGYSEGGQLTTTTLVENYPGFENGIDGNELVQTMRRQAEQFGTEMTFGFVQKIEGESSPFEVHLDNGEILVVGGGDVAMEEALYLTRFASKVTVVHRRNELRASDIMAKRAQANDKIHWMLNYTPVKVTSNLMGMTGLDVRNNETGDIEHIQADGLFVAIGHQPNTDFLDGKLALDDKGYIQTQAGTAKTSVAGIFAAGDVQDPKYQQAITAAGSGAIAALDTLAYIDNL